MARENLYSIIIEIPKKENNYLKEITEKISKIMDLNETRNEFHLTIESTLCCSDNGFRFNLNNWLETQSPFQLTLNKLDRFENQKGGIIYLTTKNLDEKNKICDLHYGIHETIKSRSSKKHFVPHITLLSDVPREKIKKLEDRFSENIKPFKITVSEVLVNKKIDNYNWKNFGRFSLGKYDLDDFTESSLLL